MAAVLDMEECLWISILSLSAPTAPLAAYDNRQYPSPENITVGFNGFTNLTFKGDRLEIEYRDLNDDLLLTEHWRVAQGQLTGSAALSSAVPGLTVTNLSLATI